MASNSDAIFLMSIRAIKVRLLLMQVKQLLQKVYYIKVGQLIKLEESTMLQR